MPSAVETFVLRSSPTSPFVRKVRMAIDVLGLADRVTLVPTDTADETLRGQNPLGKYPCLVREDGTAVYDSSVILEFLQWVAATDRLLPNAGPQRIAMLTQARLADGIIDAGALIIYEERYHDAERRSSEWLEHQRGKIRRALAVFEAAPPDPNKTDAVTIGLACALGFLDRRQPVAWRPSSHGLASWLAAFAGHEPAFERTRPPAS
ncbi:Glutathione S-transferase, N-terminal domain [Variovorax sp. CF079]|uniref:glutathione S-transferase N-terminal domain-containing protein n=1 Tax=Variovorax sp. CF079 TaxID=1882774 RepID=UPI00088B5609|nr:glutathione S-transferase N-terminal domain-containing protein [Variovorax sp. CF079]SDE79813.1 Glutathione S-transferase, N-terminal domain [Variovorax sp. CF079]